MAPSVGGEVTGGGTHVASSGWALYEGGLLTLGLPYWGSSSVLEHQIDRRLGAGVIREAGILIYRTNRCTLLPSSKALGSD